MKIQINGKTANIKLSWAAIQALKKKWGLDSINETMAKIMATFSANDFDTAFLIVSEMSGGVLTPDEAGEFIIDNMHRLGEIFAAVQGDATDPTPAPEGNPEALTVNGAETVKP